MSDAFGISLATGCSTIATPRREAVVNASRVSTTDQASFSKSCIKAIPLVDH
jgi:hypothetical protein